MRTLVGFAIAAVLPGMALAQYRANFSSTQPVMTGGVGSVVFPGGTPANSPGIQRFTPNVLYPGGGGPRLVIPNANNGRTGRRFNNGGASVMWGYPVYVGGFGDMYDGSGYAGGAPPAQQQQPPNVTIIMPPQQPPVVINQFDAPVRPQMSVYQPDTPAAPAAPAEVSAPSAPEQPHYLLAFKDHTIYSAIAYWVDGDTLHYFTAGNTHNQVSVSLIDRAMTKRLNQDAGVEVALPPEK